MNVQTWQDIFSGVEVHPPISWRTPPTPTYPQPQPLAPRPPFPLRQEFLAYPGSKPANVDFSETMRLQALFGRYSPWPTATPADPEDVRFHVAIDYGRVKLVRFAATSFAGSRVGPLVPARVRIPLLWGITTALALALAAIVIENLAAILAMVAAAVAAVSAFGGAMALALAIPVAVFDPVLPLVDMEPERVAMWSGTSRWNELYSRLIWLSVMFTADEPTSAWLREWQAVSTELSAMTNRLHNCGVVNHQEAGFLRYHLDAMRVWPALYCRDFAAGVVGD